MSKPEFIILQNKIEELAKSKQLFGVNINWAILNDGSLVATLSQHGNTKDIIFTKDEAILITNKGFTEESIRKINSALDFFPNTREPSPRKRQP